MRRHAGPVAVALALAACAPVDPAPADAPAAMPGPFHPGRAAEIARFGAADAAELEGRCEGCHEEIAAEHRGSLHRAATTDVSFARALAIEPLPFCRGCHAPEAEPSAPASLSLASIGVGCVSCHVTDVGVLAAPRADRSRDAAAPHPIVRDARFAAEGGCAGCHEFDFPRTSSERMQRTVSEHQASSFASVGCATCHLPDVADARGRHPSHAFAASRSRELVRSAVAVRFERSGPTSARVTLTPGRVGHAFPTGDLFRRVTVSAEALGDDYAVLARVEHHLARHFALAPAGLATVRTEVRDDRVLDAPRVLDLDLGPAAADAPLHLDARYERVGHPVSRDGEEARVEAEIDLADALLPP